MLQHLIISLYFFPELVCTAYIVYFMCTWRKLAIYQRLFCGILMCIQPYGYMLAGWLVGDKSVYYKLLPLDAFVMPLLLIFVAFFLYTQLRSTKLKLWHRAVFLAPPLMLGTYLITLDHPNAYQVIYTSVVVLSNLFLISYASIRIYTYFRDIPKYMVNGDFLVMQLRKLLIAFGGVLLLFVTPTPILAFTKLTPDSAFFPCYFLVLTATGIYLCHLMANDIERPVIQGIDISRAEARELATKQEVQPGAKAAEATTKAAEVSTKAAGAYAIDKGIGEQLTILMDEKKLYMKQGITLAEVADALGTNQTYLSVYLNDVQHQTFSDYINALRIHREVIPMLEKNPSMPTQDVVYAGGFNHPTTFYRAFQKITGTSFTDYRNALKKRS